MKTRSKSHATLPGLPPARRRIRPSREAGRRNDLLRRAVVDTLRASQRYEVLTNLRVPVTETARATVRLADGGYVAAALQVGDACETVTVDLIVVDVVHAWAGAYAFCRDGAQSPRARKRIEEDLRSVELVMSAYVSQLVGARIDTVMVGILDETADPATANDLTISLSEIGAHFEVPFGDAVDEPFETPQAGPAA